MSTNDVQVTVKLELTDELKDYIQREISRAINERVPYVVTDILRTRNKRK